MKVVLFVFGTRPEAIKMAPMVKTFKKYIEDFNVKVCVTAQHREMLDQVLHFFEIVPDYDLNLMKPNQTLASVTANALLGIDKVIDEVKPDILFVQGDTTSVLSGALAAFYRGIKVAHLEAGLRTGNMHSPFPEEANRVLTGRITDYHFAPTLRAVNNLNSEGIIKNVYDVGNTVIDALYLGLDIIKKQGEESYYNYFENIDFNKRIILVTGHRRESFGKPFRDMCEAIRTLAEEYHDCEFIYPVHLNPNVRSVVNEELSGFKNIHLIEPLDYPYMIWLQSKSYLILTDSGGIQEEGPSLGKPVLVMREVTERQEGIEAGTAVLVGTNKNKIIKEAKKLLDDKNVYKKMANAVNPYGNGKTSEQIAAILKGEIFE